MWTFLDRSVARLQRVQRSIRSRFPFADHLWRAVVRYDALDGGRFAAAMAYYGFFAILAMVVIGFAVLGQVFQDNALVVKSVTDYLRANLPQLETEELIASGGRLGIVALVGLVIAGVAWVDNLRSSQRALWRLDQQPGNPIIRWLIDLGVLVGLALLLLTSVSIFSGVQDLLLRLIGEAEESPLRVILRGSNVLVAGLVDVILGSALLAGVPRLRMTMRRLLPSALLFAGGFGLLKTLGKFYITRMEHNPAYQVAAGTVGLLVSMYLLHQVLLFAATLAATSQHGRVVDLASGRPPREIEPDPPE
ncbi:MAG: YihY/virulence factor BrkB family protein [Dactylosporangium sp.]|nr:YihY/virulence factor BrkB family protein [Dactylosporangium sp.]NNJ61624.1 YihY/virulence factor BrkB family protein [Dactylosporangium sp.]